MAKVVRALSATGPYVVFALALLFIGMMMLGTFASKPSYVFDYVRTEMEKRGAGK